MNLKTIVISLLAVFTLLTQSVMAIAHPLILSGDWNVLLSLPLFSGSNCRK